MQISSGCSKGASEVADALLMLSQGIENKEVQFTTQACNVNCNDHASSCFLFIENCHGVKLNFFVSEFHELVY